jgi:4-hydroxythreonine-4-phosphate dehydrogenase
MTGKMKPIIALTPGEPGGVGPEITARLFASYRPEAVVAVVVGAYSVLEPWFVRYRVPSVAVRAKGGGSRAARAKAVVSPAGAVGPAAARLADEIREAIAFASLTPGRRGAVVVLDTGCRERFVMGRDSAGGGKHAGSALEMACSLASAGLFGGIVTGPLSKHALRLAGYAATGHTEFLSRYFSAPDCQMMMVYNKLRVVPITRHIPLRRVPGRLTVERIVAALRVVGEALSRDFGIPRPHMAVCGVNPHAGEEGVLGLEEAKVIAPALARARRIGLRVTGPVPADALFQHAENGTFDAFIAMYHDQGLIPFKMISKRRGVNVTVGLPVVRTSVDHGVAYDIAGRGKASPRSLEAACRLAEALVRRRMARKGR